eukprot:9495527-Pyramimonas_sp.AAC.5
MDRIAGNVLCRLGVRVSSRAVPHAADYGVGVNSMGISFFTRHSVCARPQLGTGAFKARWNNVGVRGPVHMVAGEHIVDIADIFQRTCMRPRMMSADYDMCDDRETVRFLMTMHWAHLLVRW